MSQDLAPKVEAYKAILSVIGNVCNCKASQELKKISPSLDGEVKTKKGRVKALKVKSGLNNASAASILKTVCDEALKSNCGCDLVTFYKTHFSRFQQALKDGTLPK